MVCASIFHIPGRMSFFPFRLPSFLPSGRTLTYSLLTSLLSPNFNCIPTIKNNSQLCSSIAALLLRQPQVAAPVAAPVATPVRISPQYERFYTTRFYCFIKYLHKRRCRRGQRNLSKNAVNDLLRANQRASTPPFLQNRPQKCKPKMPPLWERK